MDPRCDVCPAGQSVQVAGSKMFEFTAPGRAYCPWGQTTGPEHAGVPRPVAAPKTPPGHVVQVAWPAKEYCPIPHVVAQLIPAVPAEQGLIDVPAELQKSSWKTYTWNGRNNKTTKF